MKKVILALIFILSLLTVGCRKKGCTDITATNYDVESKKDNGTCLYPEDITPLVIQNKLVGSWSGNGVATFSGGIEWEATFNIESNGHYAGHVTAVQSGSISSVFDNGDDNLDHPEKKITIQTIDSFGKANGKVTFVYAEGSLLEYEVKDLVFSNNYENVDFAVAWGAEMEYSLLRD